MITIDNLTRINNDTNGNPRYVIHFLELLTEGQRYNTIVNLSVNGKYLLALAKAKKIGGKKYNTKSYGGGIVFQSYNTNELVKDLNELITN
jgi:hypothetical protein